MDKHHQPHKNLTEREFEVIEKLSEGFTYQEIADMFVISINTIKTHITNIFSKIYVSDKAQAVSWFYKQKHIERIKKARKE